MRCDQFIGLNNWARREVGRTERVCETGIRYFPNGKKRQHFKRWIKVPVAQITKVSSIAGAWTDVVGHLHRYTFPDGRVFEEFIQATPWSSGPCYFIALKDKQGRPVPQSLWSQDQIDSA